MSSGHINLLYIDDDAGLGRLVQKRLAAQNCNVELATSGEAGLEHLAKSSVDAIALDQNMPGLDGLATLMRIRAMPSPPPVVFVTGAEESRIAVAALKAGAADYVTKDIQGEFIPLLKAAVDSALNTERMRRAQLAAEAETREARDRFEALAAERAMLMREVNHRVGNSLQLIASLLHMQGNANTSQDVKDALTTATNRVMAVAQVHRRLYTSEDVKSVAVDQYLKALVDDLRLSAESGGLAQLSIETDAIETEPDRAIAIGVIVNELVTNALKYAYPNSQGPIRVGLKSRDGGQAAAIIVEDDGVGFSNATRKNAPSGLGQRIVRAMAEKLGGKIEHDSAHKGTRVEITFAMARSKPATQAHA